MNWTGPDPFGRKKKHGDQSPKISDKRPGGGLSLEGVLLTSAVRARNDTTRLGQEDLTPTETKRMGSSEPETYN